MKYLFLFLFFITLSASSSTVFFADSCTKEQVKVATPNGTSLSLKLSGLDPHQSLHIKIKFKPSSVDRLKPHQVREVSYLIPTKRISRNGEMFARFGLPNLRWMRSVERELLNYRVWDAEVLWYQTDKVHSAFTTIYHPPKVTSYYEIKSESLCSWEGQSQVDSKLYENISDETMKVSRSSTASAGQLNDRGFNYGYGNNSFDQASIGILGASNFGWLFDEWLNQVESHKYITVTREYVLAKGESALFYVRPSFSRHKAIKHSWIRNRNGCGSFEAVSEGYVDIGKSLEDFMVIPSSYYGRETLLEFIEIVRPAINTCKSFPIKNVVDAEDVITS